MFAIPEQISAASKAQLESQVAVFTALTSKTFESVEQVFGLNTTAAKAALEESTAATKQLLAAKDPQEWFALAAAQAQPGAEKTMGYLRQLSAITSGVQAEFGKAAEAQVAESSRQVLALVEELTKNAPAGSENAVALVKTAIGNMSAGYAQLNKSTKQAVETIESNMNNAVGQFTPAAAKAARSTKK